MTQQTHTFQTEVQQLLHLMIHSLYSEREIFLRELISNASDACDRLRFQSLTNANLKIGDEALGVEVTTDAEAMTLVIRDNGVGMTMAEAVEHLGTIAKSGTKAFLSNMPADQAKQSHLIGQFGVGFYSAFMVADRVTVESRSAHASSDEGMRWESAGDGTFKTETVTRAARGTTVTLHLKSDAKEFAEPWRVRELVKKYSDYVAYPIRMHKYLSEEDQKKGVTPEFEQVNAGQALWTRPKDEITDEQYQAFYKAACHQWDEPATRLHVTVEGTLSFTALLFIPSERPLDLFNREQRGLSLYVRRVFIMDDCRDILPEYLRFVRGVVDSDDLPLNVSREILQQQDAVPKLRKQLVKKLLDHLLKLAGSSEDKEKQAFATIDRTFGPLLREGLVTEMDKDARDKLAKLARYASTWTTSQEPADENRRTGLDDYISRMPAGQEAIYFVTAANLESARNSPHLEGCRKKGFEVLFLADPVDEWVAQHFREYGSKKLVNAAKADGLVSDEEKKRLDEKSKEFTGFLADCKKALGDDIAAVTISSGLTDSPCRLVTGEHGVSAQMEELLRRMGQEVPKQQRTLEFNPDHPLVQRLQALHADNPGDENISRYVQVLRDQALLAEGGRIADAGAFAKRVQGLLLEALNTSGEGKAKSKQAK